MQYSELNVGDQFKYNNTIYKKIDAERVSCCRVLNAVEQNSGNKIMVKPTEEVEKITSEQQ